MIFRVYVNFKPGILDPEAEAIMHTIKNMGYKSIAKITKGKFFDIYVDNKKEVFGICGSALCYDSWGSWWKGGA